MTSGQVNVLFLASEAAPFIKIGGLGDVAGSLPTAINNLSRGTNHTPKIEVRLVIPFHSAIRHTFESVQLIHTLDVPHPRGNIPARVYLTIHNHLYVYLIEGNSFLTDSPVYSSNPAIDAEKYTFFSLAVLELVKKMDWKPNILHANDWHTALSLHLLRDLARHETLFKEIRSIISIHNLPYLGAGAENTLADYGIQPSSDPLLPEWARMFPLPLGIAAADKILTVSPNYAHEILTPEFGCGLQDYLKSRLSDVSGILNGLDTTFWNPEEDTAITARFNSNQLDERKKNKAAIQAEFGLAQQPDVPLIILISRMDQQKGVDIAINGLLKMSKFQWQAIFLGSGDPILESACRSLEQEYPDRVRAVIQFDGNLSKRLYSAGDMILIPSRYEPCGLTQMIGMHYGCIPVARATGGLIDTITDTPDYSKKTGYLFKEPTPDSFIGALKKAITDYHHETNWKMMQTNGMKLDFSWEKSAQKYLDLYMDLMFNPKIRSE
jgi:starch synthase